MHMRAHTHAHIHTSNITCWERNLKIWLFFFSRLSYGYMVILMRREYLYTVIRGSIYVCMYMYNWAWIDQYAKTQRWISTRNIVYDDCNALHRQRVQFISKKKKRLPNLLISLSLFSLQLITQCKYDYLLNRHIELVKYFFFFVM